MDALHLQREPQGLTAPDCSRQSRTERMRKASHRLIVVQYIAAEATHAREARALRQDSREHRSETDSAPTVGDHKSELSAIRIGVTNEASFRNERRDRTVKSKPKSRARQRRKEGPQRIQIRRQDRTDRNESRAVELHAHLVLRWREHRRNFEGRRRHGSAG